MSQHFECIVYILFFSVTIKSKKKFNSSEKNKIFFIPQWLVLQKKNAIQTFKELKEKKGKNIAKLKGEHKAPWCSKRS